MRALTFPEIFPIYIIKTLAYDLIVLAYEKKGNKPMRNPELSAAHYQMLSHASGISEEIIQTRGYRTETVKTRLGELGFSRNQQLAPSLVIPLYRPNQTRGGYQIRPDTPREKDGKTVKYEFPSGAQACLDVTPLDWVFTAMKDPSIPLLVTEGTKKADSAATQGLACVAVIGVWNWRGTNEHGGKCTLPDLDDIAWTGRKVYLVFDSDLMEKPPVYRTLVRLTDELKNRDAEVQFVYLPAGGYGEKTGLDDFFVRGGTQEALFKMATPKLYPLSTSQIGINHSGNDDTALSKELAEWFQNNVAFDQVTKQWRGYGNEMEGVWSHINDNKMLTMVADAIKEITVECSTSRARAVMAQLQGRCSKAFDQALRHLLPLQNGVLDMEKKKLLEHSPAYGFTWQLPYDYNSAAECPTIREWLSEAMGGNNDFVNILIAFARAAVEGRSDLEVFLEIYGPGGTGKSTYIRLLKALVGAKNAVQTDLRRLGNQFETARFYGKRLVFSPDEAAYSGSVDTLKKLTGRDPLPYERKGKDAGEDFTYEGMVIIAANQLLQSPEHTSGLARRRITVPFIHRPERRRKLIDFRQDQPQGEFAEELPGFLNLVLSMEEEEMCTLLKEFGGGTESSKAIHRETLLETNGIAAWADACLVYESGAETRVGRKELDIHGITKYKHQNAHLYPSYIGFCEGGNKNPVNLTNFSPSFLDLARHQLGYQDVDKQRHSSGMHILNVRLRREGEDDHLPRFVMGHAG